MAIMSHHLSNELARLPFPLYVMFVGLVGCGKSTIVKGLTEWRRFVVLSTDNLIDRYAEKHGITYSQAFKKVNQKDVKREYNAALARALEIGDSIIVDQTNLSASTRGKKLKQIPEKYTKVCIVLQLDETERQRRLKARGEATGKWIPDHVQAEQLRSYMTPSKSEGFDKIIEVNA